MNRELDMEIHRLLGRHNEDTYVSSWPFYSRDLNVLVDLIRRRWPEATVELHDTAAMLFPSGKYHTSLPRSYSRSCEAAPTDAERLAHVVREALKAEAEAVGEPVWWCSECGQNMQGPHIR